MTRDSINDEQAPSGPLCARLSASGPTGGISGGEGGAPGPQTGAQSLDPHALVLEAVARAVREGRYRLPADGQRAIAQAVLAIRGQEMERTTRRLTRWREMYEEAEAADQRVRNLHAPMDYWGQNICAHCSGYGEGSCDNNGTHLHPCPTITALDDQPKEQS